MQAKLAAEEAVEAMPAKEGVEEAPEGASQVHAARGAPHEPRQPTGWQFWGTSGETVWIPRGSLAATLEKCRKSTWGNGASDLESQATQHGLPQPASFESAT